MILRKIKSQSGQALIEALLALAFVVVIITAVVIAVISTLNNTSYTKSQNLATQYAQEGLDVARNMRDVSYTSFIALPNGRYCARDDGTLYADDFCSLGDFERTIEINHGGGGVCEAGSTFVSSTVSWIDSKCSEDEYCHKVQLDSCFSDPNRPFGS